MLVIMYGIPHQSIITVFINNKAQNLFKFPSPYNCLVMPLDVFLTLLINGPQLLLHICLAQNYQLAFPNSIDLPLQQSVQTATSYSEMSV